MIPGKYLHNAWRLIIKYHGKFLKRMVGFSENETPTRMSTLFFKMPTHPSQMKSYDEEHAFQILKKNLTRFLIFVMPLYTASYIMASYGHAHHAL
jgi:hypothetical protein